jgi:hypothetical protein
MFESASRRHPTSSIVRAEPLQAARYELHNLLKGYGHASLFLKDRWQLMGALEALNGTLLFGLTIAFLFAMIREVWDIERKERRRSQRLESKHQRT